MSEHLERFGYDPDDPVPEDEDGRVMPDKLLRALAAAPSVPEDLLGSYHTGMYADAPTDNSLSVLRCLSYGMTAEMAAESLGFPIDTARIYAKQARFRLRAKTTTHAVAIAIRRGLIP